MLSTVLLISPEGTMKLVELVLVDRLEDRLEVYADRGLDEGVLRREMQNIRALVSPKIVLEVLGEKTRVRPTLTVLDRKLALLATPLTQGEPILAVPWRAYETAGVNLWHLVHEWIEAHLLFEFPGLPRWAKEGLAQLGAYLYLRQQAPHLLPTALEHYARWGQVGAEVFFSWPDLKDRLGRDPLHALAQWAQGGHQSPQERARYATALLAFRERYGGNTSLSPLLERIRTSGWEPLREEVASFFA